MKLQDIENTDIAKELLVAADYYDCVHLKLYVESAIVDTFLTPEIVAELLLCADSYSCALLKEAAINMFVTNAATVKNTEAWSKVEESNKLLVELLNATTSSIKCNVEDSSDEFDSLDIAALREELGRANLPLDGSREVVVERLRTFRQRQGMKEPEGVLC